MNWKLEITRLRETALPVLVPEPARGMGAREVARVLSGVTSTLARRHGVEAMQAACAELVLDARAISSRFAQLPRDHQGKLDPKIEMLAVICRGLLHASSPEAVRAALAFWASESDPGVWQSVVLAAA